MSFFPNKRKASSVRFTDYKGAFQTVEDIYSKYPNGGMYGWFCQVNPIGEPGKSHFYYWDKDLREWKPVDEESLSDILGLSDEDKLKLENGHIIEWDAEKQEFVVREVEVFGKIEW